MSQLSVWKCALVVCLGFAVSGLQAQEAEPFEGGEEGELYVCPFIDLLPAEDGGPLFVELDGFDDEEAWKRAAFHGWTHSLSEDPDNDDDADMEWAAVADSEAGDDGLGLLYVLIRVRDDILKTGETTQCDVWKDDSVEIYVDANNDGPDCLNAGSNCYGPDDAQITVGADNLIDPEVEDPIPEELVFGGLAGGGSCDFSGPAPEVAQGVVVPWLEGDQQVGWQAEVAIALATMGNNADFTPTWEIVPEHGRTIGWNLQLNDDDVDPPNDRDHKLTWSVTETIESAWRNPGIFGKLVFMDPSLGVPTASGPVEDLSCERLLDGSVELAWVNPEGADPAVDIEILVDGAVVFTVSGDSMDATLSELEVPLDDLDRVVGVRNDSGIATECTPASRLPIEPDELGDPGGELFLNAGGLLDFEDGVLRSWRADAPYLAPSQGATNTAAFGGELIDISQLDDPDIPNQAVLEERWCDCTIHYQMIVPNDTYDVTLYFSENCAGCVNTMLGGTSADAAAARIFDVEVEGQIVADYNQADAAIAPANDGVGATFTATQLDFEAEVSDDLLDIRIIDQGGGNPPENAAVKAMVVRRREFHVDGFRRGDTDGNGSLEVTDPINSLSFQFLGTFTPPCKDAADFDDNGKIEITDPIGNLSHQFLGQAPPPAPGKDECGPDPTPDDANGNGTAGEADDNLGCDNYPADGAPPAAGCE